MKNLRKNNYFKQQTDEMKIIILYRYLSLIIMSISFFLSNTDYKFINKFVIIICITISSIILTYLYIKNKESKKIVALLVFIETLGNSIILIPSGGINSLYFWYALNTVLITSLKLKQKYSWINLAVYLFVSTGITYYIFERNEKNLLRYIFSELSHIISFVLITLALILISKVLAKVEKEKLNLKITNNRLEKANVEIKKSMEQIMALYQAVHNLSGRKKENTLIELLIYYTKRITQVKKVFFYLRENNKETLVTEEGYQIADVNKKIINNKLNKMWENIDNINYPFELKTGSDLYILSVVKSTYKNYGILGIELDENSNKTDLIYHLEFMSELSSIVMERAHLEKVNERLLINEEQNRIANEIHDSVLQKLFSMSCGIYELIKKAEDKSIKEIQNDLNVLRKCTDTSMKQLRETIYGFSWKKNGINTFEADIKEYLEEIKKLHNVDILFSIEGNCELLSSKYKKTLYRIICEGTGNAIRHGKSTYINISLYITSNSIELYIKDNGKGFNIETVQNIKDIGIGIKNINSLVDEFNGKLNIESTVKDGTDINVKIPKYFQINHEENAV